MLLYTVSVLLVVSLGAMAAIVLFSIARNWWRLRKIGGIKGVIHPGNTRQAALDEELLSEMDAHETIYEEVVARGKKLAEEVLERDSEAFRTFPRELDVYAHAAAYRGLYVCGAWSVLRHLKGQVRIRRFAGGSASAQCGLFLATDSAGDKRSLRTWILGIHAWRRFRRVYLGGDAMGPMTVLRLVLRGGFPDLASMVTRNAIRPLRDSFLASDVELHVATLDVFRWQLIGQHGFSDWEDFEECVSASNALPLLTTGLGMFRCRGRRCMDPGISSRIPPRMPPQGRAELEFCMWSLFPGDSWTQFWQLWGPSEERSRMLFRKGQDDIVTLLEGGSVDPLAVELRMPGGSSKKVD